MTTLDQLQEAFADRSLKRWREILSSSQVGDSVEEEPLAVWAVLFAPSEHVREMLRTSDVCSVRAADGRTLLAIATALQRTDIVRHILAQCPDLANARDDFGQTALMFAARNGCAELVRMLLARGADPNVTDATENTALHWAAIGGSDSITDLLVQHGIDVSWRNRLGLTAEEYRATLRKGT